MTVIHGGKAFEHEDFRFNLRESDDCFTVSTGQLREQKETRYGFADLGGRTKAYKRALSDYIEHLQQELQGIEEGGMRIDAFSLSVHIDYEPHSDEIHAYGPNVREAAKKLLQKVLYQNEYDPQTLDIELFNASISALDKPTDGENEVCLVLVLESEDESDDD